MFDTQILGDWQDLSAPDSRVSEILILVSDFLPSSHHPINVEAENLEIRLPVLLFWKQVWKILLLVDNVGVLLKVGKVDSPVSASRPPRRRLDYYNSK